MQIYKITQLYIIFFLNMPLISQIKKYNSISIVGMAKNTGKTTCLNYVLSKLKTESYKVAVTSIGVDGEEKDILYDTLKPRITLFPGNIFVTSENHFDEKNLKQKSFTQATNKPL